MPPSVSQCPSDASLMFSSHCPHKHYAVAVIVLRQPPHKRTSICKLHLDSHERKPLPWRPRCLWSPGQSQKKVSRLPLLITWQLLRWTNELPLRRSNHLLSWT